MLCIARETDALRYNATENEICQVKRLGRAIEDSHRQMGERPPQAISHAK